MAGPRRQLGAIGYLTCSGLILASVGGAAQASDPSCIERPAVVVYLHRVQDLILDEWGLPSDTPAGQEVVVRLRFREDGEIEGARVVSYTNRRIAHSVAWAMEHAGPFGPLPEGAGCLAGKSIQTTFRNPG